MWQTRMDALAFLKDEHPEQLAVIEKTFELFDACIDAYEASPSEDVYSRVCAVALIKAKNLGHGAYSLILDGFGQEAGALVRPMIEYVELLTYFRLFPEMSERAVENKLPKAGVRAKAIESIYQDFREHLNREASHSSFSKYSISHIFGDAASSLRKSQAMVPQVLEKNLLDLAVQLILLLREAVLSLGRTKSPDLVAVAEQCDCLTSNLFDAFGLNAGK